MDLQQQQTLVKQAQGGNKEALGQLWDALTPKLFGYLVNTLKNKTLAEDILQNTWLKAINALPGFRTEGGNFSAWLFAIAHNECRQYWRKSGREVELNVEQHEQVTDDAKTSENTLLIEQVMALLSEDDRELLRLRYISDLPVNDIAKVLNINFVAVRVRLHRALTRARAAIHPVK